MTTHLTNERRANALIGFWPEVLRWSTKLTTAAAGALFLLLAPLLVSGGDYVHPEDGPLIGFFLLFDSVASLLYLSCGVSILLSIRPWIAKRCDLPVVLGAVFGLVWFALGRERILAGAFLGAWILVTILYLRVRPLLVGSAQI